MLDIVGTGGVIQKQFENPKELISESIEVIRTRIDAIVKRHNSVYIDYNEDITIELEGVYEKGVVYHLICHVDDAASKYNTYTSAYLIVRRDGLVRFVISGLDRRVNKGAEPIREGSMIGKCNEEVSIDSEQLGRIIDFEATKGLFAKKKKIVLEEKERVLIEESIQIMEKALQEEKQKNSKSPK